MGQRGKYQGVTAYVGMPGSGKTYALAQVAARAMGRGERVFCNAGFDVVGAEVFSSFEDFCTLPGGSVVVWDELPLYVNSRKWSEFPDGLLYRLTQVRKDGIRLYYSAIDEAMVDLNVRRVTFWYWHCHALTGRLLVRTLWPPQSFRKTNQRPVAREFVIVRAKVARLYDSWGKVAVSPDALRKLRAVPGERWERLMPESPVQGIAGASEHSQEPEGTQGSSRRRRGPRLRGGAGEGTVGASGHGEPEGGGPER